MRPRQPRQLTAAHGASLLNIEDVLKEQNIGKKHHQNELKDELAAWSINNRAPSSGYAENMSWLSSKSKKLQQVSIITCNFSRKSWAVIADEEWRVIYSWLGRSGDMSLESTNQGFKQKSQLDKNQKNKK